MDSKKNTDAAGGRNKEPRQPAGNLNAGGKDTSGIGGRNQASAPGPGSQNDKKAPDKPQNEGMDEADEDSGEADEADEAPEQIATAAGGEPKKTGQQR